MESKGYYWVNTVSCGYIPCTALQGGVDIDGHKIYVGRAKYNDDWLPAKIIPGKKIAYAAYDGEKIAICKFQVLCEQQFDWIPASGCEIPKGAIEGGKTSDGESLYIGRTVREGSQTVGKVHPNNELLNIPFDGKEHSYSDYEILVLRH